MAERAIDTTPHDGVDVRHTSGFVTISGLPRGYNEARKWFPRLVVGSAIALMWHSAPVWVTAFACAALALQFIPGRATTA